MATQKIELTGKLILDINAIGSAMAYAKDTIPGLAGESYRRFSYDGIVFTVNTNDKFCKLLDDGELFRAILNETIEGDTRRLALVASNSTVQYTNMARTEALLNHIAKADFAPEKVDEALLNAIA